MKYRLFVLAVLAVLSAMPVKAAPAPKPRVAVLRLASNRVSPEVVKVLDEMLSTELDRYGVYDVVSASDIDAMVGLERLKDLTGCSDTACTSEVAGAIGARFVLAGSVSKLGDDIYFNLKLIDTATQVVTRREHHVADDERLYPEAVRAVVAGLLGKPVETAAAAPPKKKVDPTAPASLVVRSTPHGAEVRVAGKKAGVTDATLSLPPGAYDVAVELSGFETERRRLVLPPGDSETLDLALRAGLSETQLHRRTVRTRASEVLGVFGLAALGAFAWEGIQSRELAAQSRELTYGSSAATSKASSAKSAALLADVGLGAGSVAAIASLVLWLVRDN